MGVVREEVIKDNGQQFLAWIADTRNNGGRIMLGET